MPLTPIDAYTGPDVPLGFIEVLVPGTPVQITSVIDPTGALSPDVSNRSGGPLYPPLRFQQLVFRGMKPNATPDAAGFKDNTGNVYIVRQGGSINHSGLIVAIIKPGETLFLSGAPRVGDTYNPYRYYVDAENAGDGVLAVGITQG